MAKVNLKDCFDKMLTSRIIPILLHRGSQLVKGKQFNSWRNVGHALQATRIQQSREVDELIVLDIGATPEARQPNLPLIKDLVADCYMPITIGGGINCLRHIREILAEGADKVAIGTKALDDLSFINIAAQKFGSQAIVVSIDVNYCHAVMGRCGQRAYHSNPVQFAKRVEREGAGEILLQSIDREGMMNGYDLDLIHAVSSAVNIPVIAAGGAGTYQHMAEALKAGAHAVAAGAMFQFTDATPKGAARYLAEQGFSMRLVA